MGLDEFGDCNHVAGRGAMCVYHPRRSAHALVAMKHTLLPRVMKLPGSFSTAIIIFFSSPGRLFKSASASWTSTSSDFHSPKRGAGHRYMIQ